MDYMDPDVRCPEEPLSLITHSLHIDMTCVFLLQNGALWDICLMHSRLCEMGLLSQRLTLQVSLLFLTGRTRLLMTYFTEKNHYTTTDDVLHREQVQIDKKGKK